MRAFIVRPFGVKTDSKGSSIDFDRVEAELIGPALDCLRLTGRTTGEITEAGNIRLDMFQALVTADLVVADVSVQNANVYYELGLRHALRDKRTFLIRCADGDPYPFDLATDRYLVYDRANPAGKVAELADALRRTLDGDRTDSPIYLLLPDLRAQDPDRFLPVPATFHEAADMAAANRWAGDLDLLAVEMDGFQWAKLGLRVVGRKQRDIQAYAGAVRTWEAVRRFDPDDIEANLMLGTAYERRWEQRGRDADLNQSTTCLERVTKREDAGREILAEAYALLARNGKVRWRAEWAGLPVPADRQVRALQSGYLRQVAADYARAFDQDLNAFYPGLNAAAMLTILLELAAAQPAAWAEQADPAELDTLRKRRDQLAQAVDLAVEAGAARADRANQKDLWLELSRADLRCLTGTKPGVIRQAYATALATPGIQDFHRDAAGNQLGIYEALGVLTTNVKAALEVVGSRGKLPDRLEARRVLVFTGHQIDQAGRRVSRFPADKEGMARDAIRATVVAEKAAAGAVPVVGLAGGASGGDILFHEVCQELGIPTELYLALPRDQYIVESVLPGGADWVGRFDALYKRLPHRVLQPSKDLPRWLSNKADYGVWQRSNRWLLYNGLAAAGRGGEDVTLIALWDRKGGDGPGGTEDMVQQATALGVRPIILDTNQLFGLAPAPAPG